VKYTNTQLELLEHVKKLKKSENKSDIDIAILIEKEIKEVVIFKKNLKKRSFNRDGYEHPELYKFWFR
jgi:hypothetical protein